MKNKITTPSADKNYLEKSLDIIIKFGLKVTKVKKKTLVTIIIYSPMSRLQEIPYY